MIELLLNPGSLSLGTAGDRDPLDSHAAASLNWCFGQCTSFDMLHWIASPKKSRVVQDLQHIGCSLS